MSVNLNPQLFSFQGRVLLGTRLATGGPAALQWVGDVAPCQIKLSTTTDDVFEDFTGLRQQLGRMNKQTKCDMSMTFKQWSPAALAAGLYSTIQNVIGGTVTGEPIPTVVAGDNIKLAYNGVSSVALTDSSATPVPVNPSSYSLPKSPVANNNNGIIQFNDVGSYTQPFKAAYTYAASTNVAMFTTGAPERYFVLDGVDTETGDAVTVRLYRLRLDPISQLDVINDGYGTLPVAGSVLYDPLNAPDPDLGGFGRIERVSS